MSTSLSPRPAVSTYEMFHSWKLKCEIIKRVQFYKFGSSSFEAVCWNVRLDQWRIYLTEFFAVINIWWDTSEWDISENVFFFLATKNISQVTVVYVCSLGQLPRGARKGSNLLLRFARCFLQADILGFGCLRNPLTFLVPCHMSISCLFNSH